MNTQMSERTKNKNASVILPGRTKNKNNASVILPFLITLAQIIHLALLVFFVIDRLVTVGIDANSLSWLFLSSLLLHVFAYITASVGVWSAPSRDMVFRSFVLYLILFVWDFILFIILFVFTSTFSGAASGIVIGWLIVEFIMIVLLSLLVNDTDYFLLSRVEEGNAIDMGSVMLLLLMHLAFGFISVFTMFLSILPSGATVNIFFLLALWNLSSFVLWPWVLATARIRLSSAFYDGVKIGLLVDAVVGFLVASAQIVAVILSFFNELLAELTTFWCVILLISTFFTLAKSVVALMLRSEISDATAGEVKNRKSE